MAEAFIFLLFPSLLASFIYKYGCSEYMSLFESHPSSSQYVCSHSCTAREHWKGRSCAAHTFPSRGRHAFRKGILLQLQVASKIKELRVPDRSPNEVKTAIKACRLQAFLETFRERKIQIVLPILGTKKWHSGNEKLPFRERTIQMVPGTSTCI